MARQLLSEFRCYRA